MRVVRTAAGGVVLATVASWKVSERWELKASRLAALSVDRVAQPSVSR
jgi:hypothetical protein